MTFEEIREMVNATITENGQRQITGKALNLALIEMLTAVEEFLANNADGGAASEIFFLPNANTGELTPERKAHNAEVYNKLKSAFEEGKPLPLLSADAAVMLDTIEEQLGQPANASGYLACTQVIFVSADSPLAAEVGAGVIFAILTEHMNAAQGVILSDGNITLLS